MLNVSERSLRKCGGPLDQFNLEIIEMSTA
jgi:hypothetical protein